MYNTLLHKLLVVFCWIFHPMGNFVKINMQLCLSVYYFHHIATISIQNFPILDLIFGDLSYKKCQCPFKLDPALSTCPFKIPFVSAVDLLGNSLPTVNLHRSQYKERYYYNHDIANRKK